MSWVKVDDQFHAHPKLGALGDALLAGAGLHVLALSWSANYLMDGRIPAGQVARLGGSAEIAAALVEAGLWELDDRGYRIHDYLVYNPSRADVHERQAHKARAGHLGGLRSGEVRRKDSRGVRKQSGSSGAPAPESEQNDEIATDKQADGMLVDAADQSGQPHVLVNEAEVVHARTPEPEPGPEPEPDPGPEPRPVISHHRETTPPNPAFRERPDIDALRRHAGRVSKAQIGVLHEILDRHDVNGPDWAADIITTTPKDEDAFAAVMAADRAWRAERRRTAIEQEAAWNTVKAGRQAGRRSKLVKG